MALYVSRDSRLRVVMIPKDHGERKIGKHTFSRVMPGVSAQFRSVKPGFETSALPLRRGERTAKGMFRTEVDMPKSAEMYDVTEEELIEFLDTHPKNASNDEPGEKLFARVDTAERVIPEDSYLVKSGDGIYCRLCEKQLDGRGLQMHVAGNKHQGLLKTKEDEALSA